jgi:hypothetical protein
MARRVVQTEEKPDGAFRDILDGRNPCSKLAELIEMMAAMAA